MPNNHPYDKKSDRRQQDLNDLVGGAVNFGLGISSTVLSGIAGALDSVGDSLNRAAQRPEQNSLLPTAVSWITAWPGITAAG